MRRNKGQPIIHRYGFTQGSPLSPLLCAYALELGMIETTGLVMYADDGVVVSDKPIRIESRIKTFKMETFGAKIALDKPYGKTRKFTFLGLEYDMDNRTVSHETRFIAGPLEISGVIEKLTPG